MSTHYPHERTDTASRFQWPSLVVGVLALVACILGGLADPVHFFRAYLPAWLFIFSLSLGSMVVLMIYHLTGGAWGYLVRRILETSMNTLPLVAILFAPIAWGIRYLYPFAQPEAVAADRQLQHQTFYLTPQLFWIRAAAYFIVWFIIAFFLNAWSRRQDQSADGRLAWKCQQISAFGSVIYGVTLHFAAVDWAMSIMPAFHSSIWGPLVALGQMLSALAFTLLVLASRVDRPPLAELVCPQALGDLATLLLTFVIAWAYMAFFQFMLIWIANLPSDIIWFLPRTSPLWLGLIWTLVLLNFVVPFFLLLMRPVKRHIRRLATVAGLILAMQLLHNYYLLTPSFPPDNSATSAAAFVSGGWMNFVTPIALGGIWLGCFLGLLNARPLVVAGDPYRAAAIHLREMHEEELALTEDFGQREAEHE